MVKHNVQLEVDSWTGPEYSYQVLRGWKNWRGIKDYPPFVYLGWKTEAWHYHYLQTNKIHYVLWQGDIWVMDNQFAKHIMPVWEGGEDGQDGRN